MRFVRIYPCVKHNDNEQKTVKRKVTDLQYATTSSREWQTVGTPTTDWEMSLTVYLRIKQRLIQSGRLVKSSEAII